MDETTDEAAIRVLETETNMKNIYLEQLYTFSDIKRDPRMRVLSTAYVALIDKNKYEKVKESASWFELNGDTLSNDQEAINKKDLAFDHDKLITYGLNRIKNKIEYTDIVFNLMPEHFTLGELQQVYEVILGKKLLDPAFRRIIANKVVKTNKVKTGGGHRPSVLYKEKKK
jgi:8-oxo-dGTP diphosphatase